FGPLRDGVQIDAPAFVGDQGRTDLEDEALGVLGDGRRKIRTGHDVAGGTGNGAASSACETRVVRLIGIRRVPGRVRAGGCAITREAGVFVVGVGAAP